MIPAALPVWNSSALLPTKDFPDTCIRQFPSPEAIPLTSDTLSLLPVMWNYRGWDAARTAAFLKAFGITNASTANEIYQYIVETPGNYLKYYWGYLNFLDLKTASQKKLGDDFDLKEFHRRILEIGPVQFPVLEKYLK